MHGKKMLIWNEINEFAKEPGTLQLSVSIFVGYLD